MLVNLSFHIFLTCVVFVGGITQNKNASICQAVSEICVGVLNKWPWKSWGGHGNDFLKGNSAFSWATTLIDGDKLLSPFRKLLNQNIIQEVLILYATNIFLFKGAFYQVEESHYLELFSDFAAHYLELVFRLSFFNETFPRRLLCIRIIWRRKGSWDIFTGAFSNRSLIGCSVATWE